MKTLQTYRNRVIVIAGANGFLGRALSEAFLAWGWEVRGLVRRPDTAAGGVKEYLWDGETSGDWMEALNGSDALVNLAGRTVNCRYTEENRRQILDTRVRSTTILSHAISRIVDPPEVWLNSSTATIYRHADDGPQTEEGGEYGQGFSVETARAWERAFDAAPVPEGVRKCKLRTGLVLGAVPGTVLSYLDRLARYGLGGAMAGGKQRVSWLHVDDFVRAVMWLIRRDDLEGAFNLTAPCEVSNAVLMRELRRVTHRPFGLPAAKWMLEIGARVLRTETELVLKSRWVHPMRLLDSGFVFLYPELRPALVDLNDKLNGARRLGRRAAKRNVRHRPITPEFWPQFMVPRV